MASDLAPFQDSKTGVSSGATVMDAKQGDDGTESNFLLNQSMSQTG